ncbi:MAG TPA: chromosome partition protein MukE [Polyangiaceae bacterium]|nr:chromosome partition protein MukE [Polyangiaceae bacterium]
MTDTRYLALGDVVGDELFPDVDLALRRGRHIDREDNLWYTFLVDAQALLEAFYKRYGCELIHPADGYFYLLPTGDKLGRRHLSVPEMLVGQALTLLYLDPATLQSGGVIKRADALSHLAAVMGSDALTRAFNPKRKRVDERVAQETVRGKFAEALRRLATLGFVDLLDAEALRLRPGLLRFAEPVRGRGSPAEALERLVARGELVLGDGELDIDEDGEFSEDSSDDDASAEPAPEPFQLPSEVLSEFENFGEELPAPPEAPASPVDSPEEPPPPPAEASESETGSGDFGEPPPPLPESLSSDFDDFGEPPLPLPESLSSEFDDFGEAPAPPEAPEDES